MLSVTQTTTVVDCMYTIHANFFYDFIFSRSYAIIMPFSREIEMHLFHFVGLNICENWFEKHQFCIKNHIKSNKISISNYREETSWPLSWNYHLSADLFFYCFCCSYFFMFYLCIFFSLLPKNEMTIRWFCMRYKSTQISEKINAILISCAMRRTTQSGALVCNI